MTGRAELGRLETVLPRDIWAHEAHEFTPWLLDNADTLSEVLGIDLELTAAEHPVGAFSLDLIGRDLTNDCVLIVENQLTPTDHGHLGQLITYAAGTDAATIVWLATMFRDEHRQALDFLNELGGTRARFFGVEIGAVRIGASLPAPMFKLRAQPNDWHAIVATSAAEAKTDAVGKGALYREFWTRFITAVRETHPEWTRSTRAPTWNYYSMPSPFRSTANYSTGFAAKGKIRVELYIDSGDAAVNRDLFDRLYAQRGAIEHVFGGELAWEDLPNRAACRVAAYNEGEITDVAAQDEYLTWFLDAGDRLRRALGPYAIS